MKMAIQVAGTEVLSNSRSLNNITAIDATTTTTLNDAGFGGGVEYIRKTSNYTVESGEKVIADTSSGIWTLTLPANPSTGDNVVVVDGGNWSTNNLTVVRNGSTIEGAAENLVMDIEGAEVDFIYDGTSWGVFSKAGFVTLASTFVETEFTATALQTTFAVPYTAGLVSVYLNGVRLGAADYTATNGTSVVLATGATAGDLVEIVAWGSFDVANVATAGQGSLADSAVQPADSFNAANLTGALPAIDGSALTGISTTPTTAQVAAAIVDIATGAVGSYAFLAERYDDRPYLGQGSTLSGSSLRYAFVSQGGSSYGNSSPSGTWRLEGSYTTNSNNNDRPASLWKRIS